MKRLGKLSLAVLLLSGCIISCKEDEKVDPLVGTWTVYSEINTTCTNADDNYEMITPCNDSDCTKLTFKSDGTFKVEILEGGVSKTKTGTYQTEGTLLTIFVESDFQDPGNFTILGNTLTVIVEESATGCTKTIVLKK